MTRDSQPNRLSSNNIDARFESPIDALNCLWELRFPDIGVELDLDVTKLRASE